MMGLSEEIKKNLQIGLARIPCEHCIREIQETKYRILDYLIRVKEDYYEDLKVAIYNRDEDDIDDTVECDVLLEQVGDMKEIIKIVREELGGE
jgi:hypothetical protein